MINEREEEINSLKIKIKNFVKSYTEEKIDKKLIGNFGEDIMKEIKNFSADEQIEVWSCVKEEAAAIIKKSEKVDFIYNVAIAVNFMDISRLERSSLIAGISDFKKLEVDNKKNKIKLS